RKSMKKYVQYKEIFKITKQGLDFYEKFFDYKYPFAKYDQIFVPEFNYGAMEQPGAVTFSEHFIVRRSMTRTERAELATVITHEMAHMWFGDLVTMKWWDDLWLNESFADLMGYFTLVKGTEFKDAWENFYARKSWAYLQDQYITTHPIVADAKDTDVAFSNFDGISYAKGASVLKQLMFYIGEKNFRKGIVEYFKRYQWENTELKDFLECMEKSSGVNLKEWFKSWIETTGVNSITPEIFCNDGKISSFKIIQNPSKSNGILRQHKTKVGLFYQDKKEVAEVHYEGNSKNISEFIGMKKPDFVFLNYEDNDYVKDIFDKNSLDFILNNIEKISDNLTRQMAYGTLWQMLRDANLDPKLFIDIVIKNSPYENNLFSLERMLTRAKIAMNFYIGDNSYYEYSSKFFDLGLKMLSSQADKDFKNVWFGVLISYSLKKDHAEILLDILNGKLKFKNLEFDQEKRWAIISRLQMLQHSEADKLLEKEMENDKSDRGEKMAAISEASNLKNKEKFWKMFVSKNDKSVDYLREAMGGFFLRNQKKELRNYILLFFENIEKIFLEKDKYYAKAFFQHLFPLMYSEKEVLEKARFFLKEHLNSHKLLKKDIQEGIDDLERAMKILEKYH
ncbi:aminopeptidase N, partial [Candidatus Pacearchaeota archaeon]|nr:aminopeptidase N [Candidatus Pacearchaeota archaeon]